MAMIVGLAVFDIAFLCAVGYWWFVFVFVLDDLGRLLSTQG